MDSTFKTQCPHCSVKLKLASRPADGKSLKCPSCKETFVGSDIGLVVRRKESNAPRSSAKRSDKLPVKPSGRNSAPAPSVESAMDDELEALANAGDATDEEYDNSESMFEEDFENAEESDGWNDQELEEAKPLPPRKNSASKMARSTSKCIQGETSKSIPRRAIFIAVGGILGLAGLIAGVMFVLSVANQTEHDKLYAEWYRLTYDYAKSQNPNASSSVNAETAKKLIDDIQSKVKANGPLNFLLPEAQRQPLEKFNPELTLTPEEQAAEMMDKEKFRKAIGGFGIQLPQWLTPLKEGFQNNTLTPLQEKLFIGIGWQTLMGELA